MALSDALPGFKLFTTIIALALLIAVGMLVYELGFKKPDDLTDRERQAMNWALRDAVAEIDDFALAYNFRGYQVADIAGDTPNGQVTGSIKDAMAKFKEKGLVVKETPIAESFKKVVVKAISNDNGGSETFFVDTREQAREYVADTNGVDFLIYGKVHLERGDGYGNVVLTLCLQGALEDQYFTDTYTRRVDDSIKPPPAEGEGSGGGDETLARVGDVTWRVLVWLVAAFLLPILSAPLTSALLKLRSNPANAMALAFVTLLAVGLAFLLMNFSTGGWPLAALVGACLASGAWNYRVLTVIEKRI